MDTWGSPPHSPPLHRHLAATPICILFLPLLICSASTRPILHALSASLLASVGPRRYPSSLFFPTHTLSLQPIPLITVNESFICNQRASPLAGRVSLLLATPTSRATRGFDTTRHDSPAWTVRFVWEPYHRVVPFQRTAAINIFFRVSIIGGLMEVKTREPTHTH